MIDVRGATFSYPRDRHPALVDVSARVDAGETVGIVGPNGSGKSTLGRLMKGLLLPTAGVVCVDWLNTQVDALAVRQLVGLVFQNPNSQIVNAVVEQEVAFGPENLGRPAPEIRERVEDALRAVGLEGRAEAECHVLSMAEKQRVALAAVIAMHPRYLILDEPTAWLEPASRWALLTEVLNWSRAHQAGLVLITHRMDEALLCGRLYGMLHGRVEVVGSPEEILENEAVRQRLALELPESLALASELRAAGLPVVPGTGIDRLAEALCQS